MKKKIFLSTLIFLFLSSYYLLAQIENQSVKDDPEGKVSITNSEGNVLVDINDEVDGGSITLPSLTTIADGTGKLYNLGNQLYWNNQSIFNSTLNNGWVVDNQKLLLSDSNFFLGIGTQNPLQKLHIENGKILVRGSENWFPGLHMINQSGRSVLILQGTTSSNNFSCGQIRLAELTDGNAWDILNNQNTFKLVSNSNGTDYREAFKIDFAAPTNSFVINSNGNIGIGTLPNSNKLAVAGSIISEEVIVMLQSNWPDFVFDNNYELEDLEDVKEFINTNNHLKGIPSADEIESSGIQIGEIQSKLLQKIEELTLYIIEQNDELMLLKNEVANLKIEAEDNK